MGLRLFSLSFGMKAQKFSVYQINSILFPPEKHHKNQGKAFHKLPTLIFLDLERFGNDINA